MSRYSFTVCGRSTSWCAIALGSAGFRDGDFNPQTVLFPAGASRDSTSRRLSRAGLPVLWLADSDRYVRHDRDGTALAPMRSVLLPRASRLILLILDATGERLLTRAAAVDGKLTGRVGFLDLLYEGRWGGLISGDKATLDMRSGVLADAPGPFSSTRSGAMRKPARKTISAAQARSTHTCVEHCLHENGNDVPPDSRRTRDQRGLPGGSRLCAWPRECPLCDTPTRVEQARVEPGRARNPHLRLRLQK